MGETQIELFRNLYDLIQYIYCKEVICLNLIAIENCLKNVFTFSSDFFDHKSSRSCQK